MPVTPSAGKSAVGTMRVNKRSPTATDQTLGLHIRALRRAAGLTLKNLGEAVGVSCVQLQYYETGISRIAASRLVAISEALGVRVDILIAEAGPADAEPMSRRHRNESAELARMFKAIADPRHRLAIIVLARAIAARAGQPGPEFNQATGPIPEAFIPSTGGGPDDTIPGRHK
jgi:transcriptional regulator with XRE-family HTH domain